jgi:hypothetical protein
MFTHVCLRSPLSIIVDAIAKIKKKNMSTIKVSLSKGMALMTESTKTRRPLILVMALKGLSTRKALSELRLKPADD